jgi:hypothetical protein
MALTTGGLLYGWGWNKVGRFLFCYFLFFSYNAKVYVVTCNKKCSLIYQHNRIINLVTGERMHIMYVEN